LRVRPKNFLKFYVVAELFLGCGSWMIAYLIVSAAFSGMAGLSWMFVLFYAEVVQMVVLLLGLRVSCRR